ncbi:LOW QUALITY PROTEIN: uncharacterized protein MICPUCDRAFT_61775 [Micromonas pusilla CCMP1545]|uniref:Predicted protein n=1 Tax=Micromonas pusilla (strain CCMP1545) TaxID=564608 RepID=C1MJ07_MICPC|nr:LOW QUALITY PROTEIN: uncharacterized protein MICPUCDRAFT_61775 [Micromonas pusilla CCMP1545]EEH61004.1 predicted protein [Micromonas pusilla CCMP1545]|eukprot:XP_003055752.1 predicted protein [Micromonas pusilla CCMP1545]
MIILRRRGSILFSLLISGLFVPVGPAVRYFTASNFSPFASRINRWSSFGFAIFPATPISSPGSPPSFGMTQSGHASVYPSQNAAGFVTSASPGCSDTRRPGSTRRSSRTPSPPCRGSPSACCSSRTRTRRTDARPRLSGTWRPRSPPRWTRSRRRKGCTRPRPPCSDLPRPRGDRASAFAATTVARTRRRAHRVASRHRRRAGRGGGGGGGGGAVRGGGGDDDRGRSRSHLRRECDERSRGRRDGGGLRRLGARGRRAIDARGRGVDGERERHASVQNSRVGGAARVRCAVGMYRINCRYARSEIQPAQRKSSS